MMKTQVQLEKCHVCPFMCMVCVKRFPICIYLEIYTYRKIRSTVTVSVLCTANREVRLRVALRTDPGVALSCFSPLAALPISLWLITGVEGSDDE